MARVRESSPHPPTAPSPHRGEATMGRRLPRGVTFCSADAKLDVAGVDRCHRDATLDVAGFERWSGDAMLDVAWFARRAGEATLDVACFVCIDHRAERRSDLLRALLPGGKC